MPYILAPKPAPNATQTSHSLVFANLPGTSAQLAKRLGLSYMQMMTVMKDVLEVDATREPNDRLIATEWRQVGDGRGQPSQELVFSLRKKNE